MFEKIIMLRIKYLLKNEYFFSVFTKGIMVVTGLVESALLARYLGAELRGQLSYIYSVASTAYLVLTFGIYTIYPFKRKKNETGIEQLLNEFMTISILLFTGYFLSACLVFILGFVKENIRWILLMIPIMGYDKISSFVFMIEYPNYMNLVNVIVSGIQCGYLVLLILFVPQHLVAGISFYLLGCVLKSAYFTCKLDFKFQVRLFSFQKLAEYVRFGFFPMLALLLTTLNYRLDILMLKQYEIITMSQIGIYSIGIGLGEKALLIPDALKEILLSKLAKGKGENEVAKIMRICFLVSILTAAVITILCKFVIIFLYGYEYAGAERVTYISVWGTIVMVFFKMISQYNVVQHKQHLNVIFLLIAIGVNFVFNLFFIPRYGICGAAIATVIGHFVSAGVFLIYFKYVSGIALYKMIVIQKEDFHI